MSILLLLIPVSLLIVVIGVAAFFWAVNHRQFDDLDSAALLPMADALEDIDPPQGPAGLASPAGGAAHGAEEAR